MSDVSIQQWTLERRTSISVRGAPAIRPQLTKGGELIVIGPNRQRRTCRSSEEFVDGLLLGNIYLSDWIVSIDPTTGDVLSWFDFDGLLRPRDSRSTPDAVLNGIAVDTATGNLFVTGKLWPALFEVRLSESAER